MAAIEEAALPVFVQLGYRATTAEHLADAAGVSVRTLFRYFPSGKDDVLLAELRRTLAELEEAILARPPDEPLLEALRRARSTPRDRPAAIGLPQAAALTTQIAHEQPELMVRLVGERQMLAERLVGFFGERLQLDPQTDLRPRLFAHCYMSAMITGYLAALGDPDVDGHALVDQAIELLTPLITREERTSPARRP
jgi:AcrR family transcriptional regulator